MTTTAIPEQVTTQITIKGRTEVAEKDGTIGYKLECEAPLLYGPRKLPIIIWGCRSEDAPKLGETLAAVLTRSKQSDKYDGSKHWHYQWRWSARAGAGAPVSEKAEEEASGGPDEREHRIMRGTALAQAVALVGPMEASVTVVLETATQFYAWLRDGPQISPAQAPAATQSPVEATGSTGRRDEGPRPPVEAASISVGSVGELLTLAVKAPAKGGLGYKDKAAVFARLGIESATEIASPEKLAAAWKKLVVA